MCGSRARTKRPVVDRPSYHAGTAARTTLLISAAHSPGRVDKTRVGEGRGVLVVGRARESAHGLGLQIADGTAPMVGLESEAEPFEPKEFHPEPDHLRREPAFRERIGENAPRPQTVGERLGGGIRFARGQAAVAVS